ncbi:hypothetical protein HDV00_006262 [Rhizophlyctis rosea]|nr:hypothetical protein HDV00_006262 [Rhizophlyctis rosea]
MFNAPDPALSAATADQQPTTHTIRIINGDTIDVAIELKTTERLNPLILNMASQWRPGGGWQNGSAAQEEQLFYRSTYDLALSDPFKLDRGRKWRYPMPITGGIYTPNVLAFRGNEGTGYRVLDSQDRVFLDFVAVAALPSPKLEDGKFSQRDKEVTAEKIRAIFRIGCVTGHRDLLLGALGCGAYGNPAAEVALLFKETLRF